MTDTESTQPRDEFLARLDVAMRDVPHGIASDIRAGILEEFSGLDADAAAALIARLGDPETIAREARSAVVDAVPTVASAPAAAASVIAVAAPRQAEVTQTRGFAILAALALGFGGVVVPVVGWFAGAVLVCLSRLWRTWEKAVVIAAPAVVAVGVWIVVSLVPAPEVIAFGDGATFHGPSAEDFNPLVPTAYDIVWSASFIILLVVIPASGLWLLWRLRGRHPATPGAWRVSSPAPRRCVVGFGVDPSYREGMARIGGRSLAMSWVAGVLCAGVVGALLWFATPMVPVLGAFFGEALRAVLP